jgi:riboflavin kinase / FMN adenylyltransferase
MKIHAGYDNLQLKKPVVTIGTFDGVHLGHRLVLERLRERAEESGGESVVITFYPHPRQVIAGSNISIPLLTTPDEKGELLAEFGTDHLIVINFNRSFSNKEACRFVKEVLVEKIGCSHLIVGFNHRFGKNGKGDFVTIRECAEKFDLKVEMIDPLISGDHIVSSSIIRDALSAGNILLANDLLGYPYSLSGKIVEGKKLGRKLGFPTANIKPESDEKLIPMNGIYAVEVLTGNEKHNGVMSIGYNPTVKNENKERTIEVNIFDFEKEIYGSLVRIFFRHKLRDEMKFENLDALSKQIALDKKRAMDLLG